MKKKYHPLLILILITSSFLSFAQNKRDSLEMVLDNEKIDSVRSNILHDLVSRYRHTNTDKALRFAKQNCTETEKLANETGERSILIRSRTLMDYAMVLSEAGQFDQAIEVGKQALELAKRTVSTKQQGICYNNLGEFNRMKGDYAQGLKYIIESLKIKEAAGDKRGMGYSYHNIANIYHGLNRYNEAIENYEKAIALREALPDKQGLGDSYSNMGACLMAMGQTEKVLPIYFRSLKMQREKGDSLGVANDYNNIGSYHEQKGDYKLALHYYYESERIYKENGDEYMLGYAKISIASAFANMDQYKEATHYAKEAIVLGRNLRMTRELQDWYTILSAIHAQFKNYKEALEAKNLSVLYNDSVINETNNQVVSHMKAFYESEKQDQQIKTQKAEIQTHQEEVRRQQTQKLSLIGVMALMLALGLFIFKSYREKKKANIIILHQKELVEEKQKEILDSIYYARRIQTALMSSEKQVDKTLNRLNKNDKN